MNKIITISREFGSGGREFGRRIAELLHCAYYDHEIIQELSKRTALAEEYISRLDEHQTLPLMPITIGNSFSLFSNPLQEQNSMVYAEQSKLIEEIATKSDCIIIGRCADFILRNLHPYRIHLYSDMESKIQRCQSRAPAGESISEKELQQKIESINRQRAKYYQLSSGQNWSYPLNYDLCINTSNKDIKEISTTFSKIL